MPNELEQEKQVVSTETEEEAGALGVATATKDADEGEETDELVGEERHNLTDQSSLGECAGAYERELKLRGKSNYTITCFLSDLKMLSDFIEKDLPEMFGDFVGGDVPVGRISKEHLTAWLTWLKFGDPKQSPPPKPLAPKTMARRMTFLRNFFGWLAGEGIISEDPSANLVLERPLPPLPELLTLDEIAGLLKEAAEEPRSHCLVYLALYAGLKKEEMKGLWVHHVDLTDPHKPLITVHFEAADRKQHRERRLSMPAEFTSVFTKYQEAYGVTGVVFSCTDRNLNYILARVVKAAGIEKRVTLQLLRDTFAVQQLQDGTSFDALREKLGLSDEAWLESREKYRRLAFPKLSSAI